MDRSRAQQLERQGLLPLCTHLQLRYRAMTLTFHDGGCMSSHIDAGDNDGSPEIEWPWYLQDGAN